MQQPRDKHPLLGRAWPADVTATLSSGLLTGGHGAQCGFTCKGSRSLLSQRPSVCHVAHTKTTGA